MKSTGEYPSPVPLQMDKLAMEADAGALDVRLAPESGAKADIAGLPLRAKQKSQ